MIKSIVVSLLLVVGVQSSFAAEDAAESMVASKKKADMTYKQLMQIMGNASTAMHEGIIQENKQMVVEGVTFILTHPAPKHKPWDIMRDEDKEGFKESLLSFDKTLDEQAIRVRDAATQDNWIEANKALSGLNELCIGCHSMWRGAVK